MTKIKKYIENNLDKILVSLLLSLAYLFVIWFTYVVLDYNLGDSVISSLFLLSVLVLETLIYLTMLSYVFTRW